MDNQSNVMQLTFNWEKQNINCELYHVLSLLTSPLLFFYKTGKIKSLHAPIKCPFEDPNFVIYESKIRI